MVAEAIREAYAAIPATGAGSVSAAVSASSAAPPAGSAAANGSGAAAEDSSSGTVVGAEAQPLFSVTRSSSGGPANAVATQAADDPAEQPASTAAQADQPAALPAPGPVNTLQPLPQSRQRLVLDRRHCLRAVCGVRLVWVAADAQRKGLATKLLDCVRSTFMAG